MMMVAIVSTVVFVTKSNEKSLRGKDCTRSTYGARWFQYVASLPSNVGIQNYWKKTILLPQSGETRGSIVAMSNGGDIQSMLEKKISISFWPVVAPSTFQLMVIICRMSIEKGLRLSVLPTFGVLARSSGTRTRVSFVHAAT